MDGGGGGPPLPQPPLGSGNGGGDFLLQLLRNPPQHLPPTSAQQSQSLTHDPAVAAVGPTIIPSAFPSQQLFPSNGHHDNPYQHHHHHHHHQAPQVPLPFAPHNFFFQNYPQNPNPINPHLPSAPSPGYGQFNGGDARKLGFLGTTPQPNSSNQQNQNLMFGSFRDEKPRNSESLLHLNGGLTENKVIQVGQIGNLRRLNGLEVDFGRRSHGHARGLEQERSSNSSSTSSSGSNGGIGWQMRGHSSNNVRVDNAGPPGFPGKANSSGNRRRTFDHNVDRGKGNFGDMNHTGGGGGSNMKDNKEKEKRYSRKNNSGNAVNAKVLTGQLECPGPPAGNELPSISLSDLEESLSALRTEDGENGVHNRVMRGADGRKNETEELEEQTIDSPALEDESDEKIDKKKQHVSRDKDYRSDKRGQWLMGQRMRNLRRHMMCRNDIDRFNTPFLAIYESLIPAEEERAKQKQLLTLLEKLVSKQWPEARLFLYGSCANSFGFSKSDIDVCLTLEDAHIDKSDVLLKLADILQSDNLQNVQALTRARVPIVKLMDPVTGISCDICVNNVLAVVNTKLLRDYARIDVRLRQLAFIVKHWAKSRGVNETYQGTLSSYAYVLMCIHFLQQRRPAILPCLQGMETTYCVTVDNVECAYFDQVERLGGFGSHNGESIAQLVWAFFNYWAYCHDYATDVISVRTGSTLSKQAKDWTRRIGNDRHLICIEDPFEVSHDLGRVVDKYSIRVLREEFERAAEIMQHDTNPCITLFQPYVPT